MRLEDSKVSLGLDPRGLIRNHGNLELGGTLVLLKELGESTTVWSTCTVIGELVAGVMSLERIVSNPALSDRLILSLDISEPFDYHLPTRTRS